MAKSIELDTVSKSYPEGDGFLQVIEDVTAVIDEQEFVSILGPSGCGKTTLLKMMNGLVEPTAGTVRIGGESIMDSPRDVSMVFQTFQLFPWRTVLDNVSLGLEIQGVDEQERNDRARTWIDDVGLTGSEDRLPNELSGGMKQRVGLARALVVDPEIVLMDEPFGALDALTRDRLQTQLLQLLEAAQKTVVFVTHDIEEALFLSDRILLLSEKPANVKLDLAVEFERPRWERKLEIEESKEFQDLRKRLRSELGLEVATEPEA